MYFAVKRPNLGCRTLVAREVLKLLPVLIRELDDWVSYICLIFVLIN